MDKENDDRYIHTHTYAHRGIVFSHKKGLLAIWDNMDGSWGHYAQWNKIKINTGWSHLHAQSKKQTLMEKEIRSVVLRGRGWGVGKLKKVVKKHKLPVARQVNPRDVTFNMMTMVNTAVWHIWKLRKEILIILSTRRNIFSFFLKNL